MYPLHHHLKVVASNGKLRHRLKVVTSGKADGCSFQDTITIGRHIHNNSNPVISIVNNPLIRYLTHRKPVPARVPNFGVALMRCVPLLTLVVLIAHNFTLHAEDADEVRERGIAALKESQTNPRAIVNAARLFVGAGAMYGDAGDEEKNVEMNSFLYWCKKKMTLADIEQFTKGGEAAVTSKLAAVEKAAPKADEVQKWFDRADQFAKKNPDEHLLIAIRFYEVADRFKGVDASMQAQDRSLKEMLQEKASGVKLTPPPKAVNVPDTASRTAVPNAATVKDADKQMRDIFKTEFSTSTTPDRRTSLSKLLEKQALEESNSSLKYALFNEALAQAELAGEIRAVVALVDTFGKTFEIDTLAVKSEAMEKSAKNAPRTPEAENAMAQCYLFLMEDAVAADRLDLALHAAEPAEKAAQLSQNKTMFVQIHQRVTDLRGQKGEFDKYAVAKQKLATAPDDAATNYTAGRYLCVIKGDWDAGLRMLAKGNNTELKALAETDLASNPDSQALVTLAEKWMAYADRPTEKKKSHLYEHVAKLCEQALVTASGMLKTKINKRLSDAKQMAVAELPKVPTKIPIPGTHVGTPYQDISENWRPLVGLATVIDPSNRYLQFIQPIYDGTKPGKTYGGGMPKTYTKILAKPGYVVGALVEDGGIWTAAVKVVFVRYNANGTLDWSDSYESDWVGKTTNEIRMDAGTKLVVGIYGNQETVVDSLGLIVLDLPKNEPPPPPPK